MRILLWFIAILLSFDLLAPTQETFFAAIGSVAIAIGLGAQDLIKNLIGGFVVLGDRPYQIGDRVRIGDADGEIVHIGLRSTKLITLDDTRITIPNAMILDNARSLTRTPALRFARRSRSYMSRLVRTRSRY